MDRKELKELFFSLVEYTYIYGFEDEVNDIIPNELQKDSYGNYFIKIGESKTMFVSHLDTVGDQKSKVNFQFYNKNGHQFVKTDGTTILGADDKAGVLIMLNMIENNVPGLYYFLIGEEVGTIGSKLLYQRQSKNILSNYDRCISFDRKGYGSIINRQMGKYCCSDDFVDALSNEFSKHGLEYKADPYGVWTDSALFMGTIPECTNLSVGYFNEHTKKEEQDLDYLLNLCEVATKINWEVLPVVREPKAFDTVDPDDVDEQDNHLPLRKLRSIMDQLDDIIYDSTHMYASNINFFKPEKEMTYFNHLDLNDSNNFSLIVHLDGGITFNIDGEEIYFDSIKTFKEIDMDEIKEMILRNNITEKIITKFNKFNLN